MSFECKRCGAPLPAPTSGQVTCAYCGAVTLAAPGRPERPPQAPRVTISVEASSSASRQTNKILGTIVVIMVLTVAGLIAGGVILEVLLAKRTTRGAVSAPSDVSAPWLGSRACLLGDATGDGVRDVGALVGRGADQSVRLALLDGATGELVWEGSPTAADAKELLCLGPAHLGVVDQRAFELTLVPASVPAGAIRRTLSDELTGFGFDGACLSLQTKDGASAGMAIADGSAVACPARARIRPEIDEENASGFRHGIISVIEQPFDVRWRDARYALRARQPGTPFLEVEAHRGGARLWSQRLPYVPAAGEAIGYLAATAAPDVVVVLGSRRDRREDVVAVALDASTGNERWTLPLPPPVVVQVRGLFFNGRYVVVALSRSLTAIDPATGRIAWQLAQ